VSALLHAMRGHAHDASASHPVGRPSRPDRPRHPCPFLGQAATPDPCLIPPRGEGHLPRLPVGVSLTSRHLDECGGLDASSTDHPPDRVCCSLERRRDHADPTAHVTTHAVDSGAPRVRVVRAHDHPRPRRRHCLWHHCARRLSAAVHRRGPRSPGPPHPVHARGRRDPRGHAPD
jgi:hypothetical protein